MEAFAAQLSIPGRTHRFLIFIPSHERKGKRFNNKKKMKKMNIVKKVYYMKSQITIMFLLRQDV